MSEIQATDRYIQLRVYPNNAAWTKFISNMYIAGELLYECLALKSSNLSPETNENIENRDRKFHSSQGAGSETGGILAALSNFHFLTSNNQFTGLNLEDQ